MKKYIAKIRDNKLLSLFTTFLISSLSIISFFFLLKDYGEINDAPNIGMIIASFVAPILASFIISILLQKQYLLYCILVFLFSIIGPPIIFSIALFSVRGLNFLMFGMFLFIPILLGSILGTCIGYIHNYLAREKVKS